MMCICVNINCGYYIIVMNQIVSLFHVLFVAPLLIYVGRSYGELPWWMFKFLIFLAVGIVVAHGPKLYNRGLIVGWFFALHVFVFAPLLFYLGYAKDKAFPASYPTLAMLGYATLGYHIVHLVEGITNH